MVSAGLGTILTDDHDCEVSATFGDNSVPLKPKVSGGGNGDELEGKYLVGQVCNTDTC